jgi:hypothetical protein
MRQFDWTNLSPKICQLAEDAGRAIMRIYEKSADVDVLKLAVYLAKPFVIRSSSI